MGNELGQSYAQAWSSKRPERVAEFFAENGQMVINDGEPLHGRDAIATMAAGFYAAFPDLVVHCDDIRRAGPHCLFVWTLAGHHGETGRPVTVGGWEEWDLDSSGKISASRGWFDTVDYEDQIAGRTAPS